MSHERYDVMRILLCAIWMAMYLMMKRSFMLIDKGLLVMKVTSTKNNHGGIIFFFFFMD